MGLIRTRAAVAGVERGLAAGLGLSDKGAGSCTGKAATGRRIERLDPPIVLDVTRLPHPSAIQPSRLLLLVNPHPRASGSFVPWEPGLPLGPALPGPHPTLLPL